MAIEKYDEEKFNLFITILKSPVLHITVENKEIPFIYHFNGYIESLISSATTTRRYGRNYYSFEEDSNYWYGYSSTPGGRDIRFFISESFKMEEANGN